jgi:lipoyl(octanoyl) transferase
MSTSTLTTRWLGSAVPYEEALATQEELVAGRRAGQIPDTLLLLEHAPVYTIGRTRDQSSLGEASMLPHPAVVTNRGGQGTYHGPGQLVGYPIVDLAARGKDLHLYLRLLEESLIGTLSGFGIEGSRREGLTGVWVGNAKIASVGVGVRKWISMHGFALNITHKALPPFRFITPCGIDDVAMTCMEQETGAPHSARQVGESFAERFARDLHPHGPVS